MHNAHTHTALLYTLAAESEEMRTLRNILPYMWNNNMKRMKQRKRLQRPALRLQAIVPEPCADIELNNVILAFS